MATNPILTTDSAAPVRERFARLSPEAQREIKAFLRWLYGYARDKAETSWRQSKAPMAVYWRAVAAWSYHLARAIKPNP